MGCEGVGVGVGRASPPQQPLEQVLGNEAAAAALLAQGLVDELEVGGVQLEGALPRRRAL